MCGNADFRLRREAVEGTINIYPMYNEDVNYGAIISGEHIFYIVQEGRKEYADGHARFTHLWKMEEGKWVMSRILSYDHGPVAYVNQRKSIALAPSDLKKFEGKYESRNFGTVTVLSQELALDLIVGNKTFHLFPETEKLFFVKDRDLTFEFVSAENDMVRKIIVRENGDIVDEMEE